MKVHSVSCNVPEQLSASQCANLGYTSQLMCGMCSKLKENGLEKLEENCLKCCQKEAEDSEKKVCLFVCLLRSNLSQILFKHCLPVSALMRFLKFVNENY